MYFFIVPDRPGNLQNSHQMESTDTPTRPALTFEEMPQAVSNILDRLDSITTLINDKFDRLTPKKEDKEWMDINVRSGHL